MSRHFLVLVSMLALCPWARAAEQANSLYVLTLQHARNQVKMYGIPLQVWMECEGTTIRRTLALGTQGAPAQLPVDVSQLQVSPERLAGSISVKWPDIGEHAKAADRTYTLDLPLRSGQGSGNYAGGDGKKGVPPCELADVRRVEWTGLPATAHWEVVLASGRDREDAKKVDNRVTPVLALRFSTRDGKATSAWAYACDTWASSHVKWEHPLAQPVSEAQITFRDNVLSGQVKLPAFTAGQPGYEIELSAQVVGLRLGGAARIRQADKQWDSPVAGIASGAAESNHFPTPKNETWPWSYTAKPDAALVAEAVMQANEAVFPGDPKGREFWSWRFLLRSGGRIDCIHPPSFDIQEMPGAVKYRLALRDAAKSYSCEVDKPWRPLTALWKDLPYGQYKLSVTGLDAAGKELDAKPQFRWWKMREKKEELGPDEQWRWNQNRNRVQWDYKGQVVIGPLDQEVVVLKRRPFDGPYFERRSDVPAAALRAARAVRDAPVCPQWRGMVPYAQGLLGGGLQGLENLFRGGGVYGHGALLCAALSPDPRERIESLLLADGWGNGYLNGRLDGGMVMTYGDYMPIRIWDYQLLSRLRAALPGKKYEEARHDLVKRLMAAQLADGSFGGISEGRPYPCKEAPGWYLPGGVFHAELDRFNPGTMIYMLGCYRQETKSEEFSVHERKSLEYLRRNLTGDFFWPEHGPHSLTASYPAPAHGVMLHYFCLYLLECARPEDRDSALVERLALWCEDRNVIWDRSAGGDAVVRPTAFLSFDGGRSGGKPAENVARLAHLYARLWQATGKPLHRAKAEALLGSLLACQSPETGLIPMDLEAKQPIDPRDNKTFQPAHPMQRYGLMLWEMLSAAESLAEKR